MSNKPLAIEAPAAETGKTVIATVTYRLSEEGQKAALLAGKPAAGEQSITGPIPVHYLDKSMVTIGEDGSVMANLTTSVRVDFGTHVMMRFNQPPASAEEALAATCARIEEEKANKTAQKAAREAEEAGRFQRHLAAETEAVNRFFADATVRGRISQPNQEALIPAGDGFVADVTGSVPGGRAIKVMYEPRRDAVMAEIARREQIDIETKELVEAGKQASKRAFLADFLEHHGTPNQIERFQAAMLPEEELANLMEQYAFAPLAEFPLYRKIEAEEVYDALTEDQRELVDNSRVDPAYRATDATTATASEWATLKSIEAVMPGAACKLRVHDSTYKHDDIPWGIVTRQGIQVKVQYGPFTFVRDFACEPCE